jgi:magnesium-protoporphyrin IX monomethyl ester (oxidative) cyclase
MWMKVLLVHPSSLMYSEIYLRLEPLGVERVAQAVRAAGHEVRLLDLQLFRHEDYFRELREFKPQAVGFSLNYLANVPEVLDLAKATKEEFPRTFVFTGGHSGSFIADELIEHGQGAVDAVVRGEGELVTPQLLEAFRDPQLHRLPGLVTGEGAGPKSELLNDLELFHPARDLTRNRRKYFIGVLDPCASIEFTRGCPWDCSFCSAWTFYGKSYRKASAESIAEELDSIREPNVFIVDDVAFIHPEHGHAIADEIEKRRIRKQYYIETRCDVLVRNQEVFRRWAGLGLRYMFLGFESLSEEQLKLFRKRATPNENFQALEVARSLGITVALNLISDPGWDEKDFARAREWALEVPEIVHLTVATPYPGTELWYTESRKLSTLDYRLFDVQHAVLPTRLPLERFYQELVDSQNVINRKHLGFAGLSKTAGIAAGHLLRGQTNFLRMLWKFKQVYNAKRQYGEHLKPVRYSMKPPRETVARVRSSDLYLHSPSSRVEASPRLDPAPSHGAAGAVVR